MRKTSLKFKSESPRLIEDGLDVSRQDGDYLRERSTRVDALVGQRVAKLAVRTPRLFTEDRHGPTSGILSAHKIHGNASLRPWGVARI